MAGRRSNNLFITGIGYGYHYTRARGKANRPIELLDVQGKDTHSYNDMMASLENAYSYPDAA